MLNITSDIIAYENGELDQDETIAFFQKLLDTGIINHLQGHYGRTAAALIQSGDIVDREAQRLCVELPDSDGCGD